MTEKEKIIFKQIEEKSKSNPMVKIELAAKETAIYTMGFCKDDKGRVGGDSWLYLLSTMAGVSCAKISRDVAAEMLLESNEDKIRMPFVPIETPIGKFYFGDAVNKYLFADKFSVINVFYNVFSKKNSDVKLPDVASIVNNNAKVVGDENYRVWNNLHNPYAEKNVNNKAYEKIIEHLEPFKLERKQIPAMFGLVLAEASAKAANVFPKELNCFEMMVETIVFNAHMDY